MALNSTPCNHEYYYQVQVSCEVDYCDFVVWTLQGIVVIRIRLYPDFINVVKPKLDTFFVRCILPNLMAQHIKKYHQHDVQIWSRETHRQVKPWLRLYSAIVEEMKMSDL